MQRRFESERRFQAVMPLLQERIPAAALFAHSAELSGLRARPPRSGCRNACSTHPKRRRPKSSCCRTAATT
jgi:hypothetical protein